MILVITVWSWPGQLWLWTIICDAEFNDPTEINEGEGKIQRQQVSRDVSSLTVPNGQELNFSLNFDQVFLFFLKLFSFSPHFGPPGGQVAHPERSCQCHCRFQHLTKLFFIFIWPLSNCFFWNIFGPSWPAIPGKSVESGNLIPRKFCYWREILVNRIKKYIKKWWEIWSNWREILDHIPGKCSIFTAHDI